MQNRFPDEARRRPLTARTGCRPPTRGRPLPDRRGARCTARPDPCAAAPTDRADWWRTRSSTRSTSAASPTATATASATWPASASRLGYLRRLGVDALWLTPFYPSPMADHGYDVADPRDVEPLFGDLAEFDALVAERPRARPAGDDRPGARTTARTGTTGSRPRWRPRPARPSGRGTSSATGAGRTAASRRTTGRRSSAARPGPGCRTGSGTCTSSRPSSRTWTWTNPEVVADLETTMRFWLDRGVDGFRIDVAHGMAKPEGLPDMVPMEDTGLLDDHGAGDLRFDQDGVHAMHRRIRAVARRVPGPDGGRRGVGRRRRRGWRSTSAPDELQLAFNFRLLTADWTPTELRDAIDALAGDGGSRRRRRPAGCCPTTTSVRHVTRYGGGRASGSGRARAAALLQLALPGAVYVYNGDELGAAQRRPAGRGAAGPDVGALGPHRARPGRRAGADAVVGREPPYGFSTRARHLAADARGVGGPDRRGPGGGSGVDTVALPAGAGAAATTARLRRARSWSGCRRRTVAWPSAVPAAWSAWSTPPPRPVPMPRGRGAAGQRRRSATATLPADAAVWLQG